MEELVNVEFRWKLLNVLEAYLLQLFPETWIPKPFAVEGLESFLWIKHKSPVTPIVEWIDLFVKLAILAD